MDPSHASYQRPPLPPRPDWHAYFMSFAKLARTRASCIRRQVGAVVVKEHMVLTTGYNGAPRGLPHASEVGCLRDALGVPSGQNHELCRGLHAEQNAIIQAARHGICIDGSVMYCTHHPCSICLKMIINVGLVGVFYLEGYPDPIAQQILAESGFPMVQIADGDGSASRRSLPMVAAPLPSKQAGDG